MYYDLSKKHFNIDGMETTGTIGAKSTLRVVSSPATNADFHSFRRVLKSEHCGPLQVVILIVDLSRMSPDC